MIFLYIDYISVLYLRASNCRVKIPANERNNLYFCYANFVVRKCWVSFVKTSIEKFRAETAENLKKKKKSFWRIYRAATFYPMKYVAKLNILNNFFLCV